MPNTDEVLGANENLEEAAAAVTEEDVDFKKKKDEEDTDDTSKEPKDGEEGQSEDSKASSDSKSDEEDKGDEEPSDEEDEDEKKKKDKKAKYNLDEIPEYVELSTNYSAIIAERDGLNNTVEELKAQIASLTEFKNNAEKEKKQEMINSFYMLSDEEKQDVVDNIDKYSLDEIEAKLSVICVRKKVSFALEEETEEEAGSLTYNLDEDNSDSAVPAWIKAVLETSKDLK